MRQKSFLKISGTLGTTDTRASRQLAYLHNCAANHTEYFPFIILSCPPPTSCPYDYLFCTQQNVCRVSLFSPCLCRDMQSWAELKQPTKKEKKKFFKRGNFVHKKSIPKVPVHKWHITFIIFLFVLDIYYNLLSRRKRMVWCSLSRMTYGMPSHRWHITIRNMPSRRWHVICYLLLQMT